MWALPDRGEVAGAVPILPLATTLTDVAELLAVMSSLLVGCADFLAGRLGRRVSPWAIAGVSSAVAALVFLVLGTVTQSMFFDHIDVRAGVLTGIFTVVGNGLYFQALARGTMGVVGGIVATLVVVPVLASLAHGVSLSTQTLVGIAVTVGSAILLGAPDMRGGTKATAVLLAAVAAVMYGLSEVTDDVGSADNLYGTLMVMEVTAAAIVGGLGLFARSMGGLDRTAMPELIVIGLFSAGSWACFAEATTVGNLADVAVLSSLGPVVITLLAFFILKQKLQTIQIVALIGVLVGSMLVSAGQ